MPVYAYKGVDTAGKNARGFIDADTLRSARLKLRRDGVFPTDVAETDPAKAPSTAKGGSRRFTLPFAGRIAPMDLTIATRQLSTLVGADIPLVEALGALTEQVESNRLKGVIGRVRDRVNEGATLADALADSGPFSELYVSMVRAGEAGGALEAVLARLADYLEGQMRLRNRVMSIVLYPIMMAAFAGLVVAVLVTVVLPQITTLLESLNKPLPIYTRAIISVSDFARSWWWAVLSGGVLAGLGARALLATEAGRARFDAFKLRAPLLGRVTRKLAIARFSRTLSTLLSGGIPITQALDISRYVASNVVIGKAVEKAGDSLREGASLAKPMRESGQFPPLVTHMVAVGESSGELEAMLAKVAETYDEQVEQEVTRMTALLEPLLILVMVVVVLMIIMAVLVPILDLTGSFE